MRGGYRQIRHPLKEALRAGKRGGLTMSAPTDYITKAGEFHSVVTPTSLVCAYNLDQNQLLIKITLRSKSPFDSMEPPAYRTDTPLNLAGIKKPVFHPPHQHTV